MKETEATPPITFLYRSLILDPKQEFSRIIKTAIVIGGKFFTVREKHDIADIGDYIFVHKPFNKTDAERIARESQWYGGSSVDQEFLNNRFLGNTHQPKTIFTPIDLC